MPDVHVFGLLQTEQEAESLVRVLQTLLPKEQISLIHRAEELHLTELLPELHSDRDPLDSRVIGTGIGAALGLTFVGTNLMLVGATAAIAGFGPLAAVLYTGLFGGLHGSPGDDSITPPDLDQYLEQVQHGKLLVHAVTDPDQADLITQAFLEYHCDLVKRTSPR
ncbi:MAG: hypothetical protein JWN30_1679 [Bacilli bacterium]|nr:hypothetical protein [Bacilli bacterium]